MSKSKKLSRLGRRADAVKRHGGNNELQERPTYVYVLPLGLSWAMVFILVIGLVFVFSKKSAENMQGKVIIAEARQRELNDNYQREKILWEQMTTPQQLRIALLNNGIRMTESPSVSQRVVMGRLPDYDGSGERGGTRYAAR